MTGLTSCCRKRTYGPPLQPGGTLTEEISEQTFRKERRLQAKHLWMEVKLSWHVLADRMYTSAPTGKSREQLTVCTAFRQGCHDLKAVQVWWEQCKEWMPYFKGQSAPLVQDLQGLLQAFRGKEEVARTEVETFMEHCAKRWQTKEGTYQLKRRRLLPDVRDPPAWARKCRRWHEGHLKITRMAWRITTWWKRCYEGLRGARFVSPLSHIFCEFSQDVVGFCCLFVCLLVLCVVLWFGCCGSFLFGCFLWKFCTQLGFISFRISSSWPTMSRARSAMQEKKKSCFMQKITKDPDRYILFLPWDIRSFVKGSLLVGLVNLFTNQTFCL